MRIPGFSADASLQRLSIYYASAFNIIGSNGYSAVLALIPCKDVTETTSALGESSTVVPEFVPKEAPRKNAVMTAGRTLNAFVLMSASRDNIEFREPVGVAWCVGLWLENANLGGVGIGNEHARIFRGRILAEIVHLFCWCFARRGGQ